MDLQENDSKRLLRALNAIQDFPKMNRYNTRSKKMFKKNQNSQGYCIGCVKAICHSASVGKKTGRRDLLNVERELIRIAQTYFPEFCFSSIQINKNFGGALHVDSSNVGASKMLVVGSRIRGGELYVDKEGIMETQNKIIEFDGNSPHMTMPYKGTRYSVVFFTNIYVNHLSTENKEALRSAGFNLPEDVPSAKRHGMAGYVPKADRLQSARENMPVEVRAIAEKLKRVPCSSTETCRALRGKRGKNYKSDRKKLKRAFVANW